MLDSPQERCGLLNRHTSGLRSPAPKPISRFRCRMPRALAHKPRCDVRVRRARRRDLDALNELEHRVFATDRLSRRSLRHLLASPSAEVLVVEESGRFAGTAIVLFRTGSALARLYSLAVAPHMAGRGFASLLLGAV